MSDVRITSIDVPFGEILWLTFKAFFASMMVAMLMGVISLIGLGMLGISMFG